jgi:hypothetical protein
MSEIAQPRQLHRWAPFLMTKELCAILACMIFTAACFPCRKELPAEPPRPTRAHGWNKYPDKESGVTFCADLLLKPGQSSDNGKYGVRVTRILDAELCCGDQTSSCNRRANIQFFRVSDNRLLCEMEMSDRSNAVIPCASEIDSSVIGVWGINATEQWVSFDLRC